jgi:DNA-binding transcriptional ArsR family regulator
MEKIVNGFKALSDETRLRIINLFIKSRKNLCVCELMDALRLPQYSISKALIVLKGTEFLISKKEGTWVYYELNKEQSNNLLLFKFLEKYLDKKIFQDDEKRLNQRLLLRKNDKCVVGIIPEKELFKRIKEKIKR